MIELRCGDWRDVLGDVECDALITDPPYSARTDKGFRSANDFGKFAAIDQADRARKNRRSRQVTGRESHIPKSRFELPYPPITEQWVAEFADFWIPRTREWFVIFGDHISNRWFEDAFTARGLLTFAPVPWVRTNSAPRFNADGPANACEWIMIARHRKLPRERRSRRGYYMGTIAAAGFIGGGQVVTGGKPTYIMREIIQDYSLPGDLICDPCAGGATTLLAARLEGRRAVGAEINAETYEKAQARLRELPGPSGNQTSLFEAL